MKLIIIKGTKQKYYQGEGVGKGIEPGIKVSQRLIFLPWNHSRMPIITYTILYIIGYCQGAVKSFHYDP